MFTGPNNRFENKNSGCWHPTALDRGANHTSQFKHHLSASPAVIVRKVVGPTSSCQHNPQQFLGWNRTKLLVWWGNEYDVFMLYEGKALMTLNSSDVIMLCEWPYVQMMLVSRGGWYLWIVSSVWPISLAGEDFFPHVPSRLMRGFSKSAETIDLA